MDKLKIELKDLSGPASIAALTVLVSAVSKKLAGYSLGVEGYTLTGAIKAFALITASGGAAIWYNKESIKL